MFRVGVRFREALLVEHNIFAPDEFFQDTALLINRRERYRTHSHRKKPKELGGDAAICVRKPCSSTRLLAIPDTILVLLLHQATRCAVWRRAFPNAFRDGKTAAEIGL